MSMKMMPRFSTIAPSGTCVDRMSSPATSAGPRMATLRAFMAGEPVEEPVDRVVVEREEVGCSLCPTDGDRHLHHRNPSFVGNIFRRLRILVGPVEDELDL